MGIIGLRKFIDSSSCSKLLHIDTQDEDEETLQRPPERNLSRASSTLQDEYQGIEGPVLCSSDTVTPHADHVLVDLNCIVHSSLRKSTVSGDVSASGAASMTKRDLIQAVLQRLRFLLTRVVVPTVSLTICIDGPAPYAKLGTQRMRRRQVGLLDTSSAQQLSSLAITPGSLLLVELENALAAQFKLRNGKGFLAEYVPVFLHGSTVAGEGEAKIARSLAFLASGGFGRHSEASRRYNPNDTIVVIGNDIDLTLTCIGATQYHNFSVLGPSSMHLIDVSTLLYRWLYSGVLTEKQQLPSCGEFRLTARELASVRVDFVFLFLLNGGDHYAGAGEVAHVLWRRYRTVRGASSMKRSLVSEDLCSVDVDMLADVLQSGEYTGDVDTKVGMQLLRATLWSLQTTVSGACPDYRFVPRICTDAGGPHLNHVRAAVAHCHRKRRPISFIARKTFTRCSSSDPKANAQLVDGNEKSRPPLPLTPLETLVALMPTEASLPTSVATALRSSRKFEHIAHVLVSSNDAHAVADAAREAVEAADAYLTASERYLRDFTDPVQINVPQKAKRLSRHEQHRMLATTGTITVEQPMPVVRRVQMPESFRYLGVDYPTYVKDLIFFSPLDLSASGEAAVEEAEISVGADTSCHTTGNPYLGHENSSFITDIKHAIISRDCVAGVSKTPSNMRRVPAHPSLPEATSLKEVWAGKKPANVKQAHRAEGAERNRHDGAMKNGTNHHNEGKTVTGESMEELRRHFLRKKDKAFVKEVKQFLGSDDFDKDWVVRGRKKPETQGKEKLDAKKNNKSGKKNSVVKTKATKRGNTKGNVKKKVKTNKKKRGSKGKQSTPTQGAEISQAPAEGDVPPLKRSREDSQTGGDENTRHDDSKPQSRNKRQRKEQDHQR